MVVHPGRGGAISTTRGPAEAYLVHTSRRCTTLAARGPFWCPAHQLGPPAVRSHILLDALLTGAKERGRSVGTATGATGLHDGTQSYSTRSGMLIAGRG